MQKEISRRARLYGVAAVLLAVVLVSLCYQLGYIPQAPTTQISAMATFSSYDELCEFLKKNSQPQGWYPYRDANGGLFIFASPGMRSFGGPQAFLAESAFDAAKVQHSTTNIQVTGVDEADSVKTDEYGYIYLITGYNITILRGYPPETAQIVTVIHLADMAPMGIFVNGDRLTVLGTKYNVTETPNYEIRWSYYDDVSTYAKVYDVSNRSQPQLVRTYTTSGSYFSSRMIGDYVYFIASAPAFYTLEADSGDPIDNVTLPKIERDGNVAEVNATEIHYSNTSDNYFMFTTIVSMNIQNLAEEPSYRTVMTGGASNMYVSQGNIYITFPSAFETSIYRIHIENNTIIPEAQGSVPGSILNQFSMDEYNNYFRVATTTWNNNAPIWDNSTKTWVSPSEQEHNNVYALNMNMSIVGNLTGLAPGEHIYSARFMGNKCYLVTFVKIDPLFVIDLSDPTDPKVLGELKIPGYSDYLHPYDENHLIGVGKHTEAADEGFFAWYQGVKIALFDVSNTSNPIQIANYTIGERGSDSPVLRDHKAFLFDRQKNLLVIPALVAQIDRSEYPGEVPPWAYGKPVWQGAIVFNVTLEEGFAFRGGITHIENITEKDDWNYYVQRSLYIEDALYTISNSKVKMNNLQDLAFLREVRVG